MKVAELKNYLASLPEKADNWDVCFTAENTPVMAVSGATKARFDKTDVPDGFTEDFILLYSGEKP